MQCYKNGQLIDSIPLLDRAFHYGDGCFTTARIFDGCFELKELHFARLQLACQHLSLKTDLSLIDMVFEQLQQQFQSLNGTLKVVISRGEGDRGYSLPLHAADLYVWYYPKVMQAFQPEWIESGLLNHALGLNMPHLVGLKTLNRLEQVLLKQEADQRGWLEALVSDVQGYIVEGVSSNCFIRINDQWITPELRYNGVHGVMRAKILSRMQQYNVSCEQRCIGMDEIDRIQNLFFCNALHPMRAVVRLNDRALAQQPYLDLFETLKLSQID
ncbi:aminodeoxychorismate lyase [Acinetobacter haemolyticus]|uniref:Aminodeoxychorismate lyase n=1 Tax=Acinetobacter haemolyticus TaxID=29430 RepID=A0AAJ2YRD4_ACIHA|nr:aminodeoxychorismate lyase [Acinetobacter haemolyticus]AZN68507.1 aminodeoxychorismate lyase [Acinetobacter haemolyticus]MBO3657312.1 aminodeoxychorismate lyase [Acinetobacter haemolyticus]NAR57611.1 aminodeoxychorismate lyase [Acinetobacter haemolyticus]NAR71974.1 aminodeoxychorismate lyase [Acinetobacter haemolyticus]NAR80426.1 aminodeoxychorismate lyase [Acinetobacter haemolyticus]